MFMRIYWGRVESDRWDDIEAAYRDLNRIGVPGLQARWVTQDVKDPGNLFTVTLWDSAEAVQAWEDSDAYRETFQARIAPFLEGSQTVSLCEVRVENVSGASTGKG